MEHGEATEAERQRTRDRMEQPEQRKKTRTQMTEPKRNLKKN